MKLNMHYEALLNAQGTSSPTHEFGPDTVAAAALERLSMLLQTMLHSAGGESASDLSNDAQSSSLNPIPQALEDDSADPDAKSTNAPEVALSGMSNWAYAREEEIARLEVENEALRRALGIDAASAAERGWLAAEQDETQRMSLLLSASASFTRGSHMLGGPPPHGGLGASPDFPAVGGRPPPPPLSHPTGRVTQTAWGSVRMSAGMPGLLVTNSPAPVHQGPGMGGMLSSGGQQPTFQAPPVLQSQPSQPPYGGGTVGAGMRGGPRRPAMFGQRGGGRGGGPASGYWAPPAPEIRPWPGLQHNQGGLDLR
jgi:hypothetical protein